MDTEGPANYLYFDGKDFIMANAFYWVDYRTIAIVLLLMLVLVLL